MEVDHEQEDKMEIDEESSPIAITPKVASEVDRIIDEIEKKMLKNRLKN